MTAVSEPVPFVLVTGNPNKRREAERILGRRLEHADIDLPEIQELDLGEVLAHKARQAYERVGSPVVVEETGLFLAAMGGFPGPLIKWMLDAMGAEGVAHTARALGDPAARAVCALAFHDGERLVVAEGETRGRLVAPPRGEHGFGWDPVFEPEASRLTFAQLDPADKDRLGHRGRAWRAFRCRLRDAGVL